MCICLCLLFNRIEIIQIYRTKIQFKITLKMIVIYQNYFAQIFLEQLNNFKCTTTHRLIGTFDNILNTKNLLTF